jgi:hypothetical protein
MRPEKLVLRCYAERESDGSWFVICLDLNLYARADSLPEARAKLHDFIGKYVTDAVTRDQEHIADLIPRRAPFSFWVRYYCIKAIVLCGRSLEKLSFKEPLPLVPAA